MKRDAVVVRCLRQCAAAYAMTALLSGCYLSRTLDDPLTPGHADAGDGGIPDTTQRSGWVSFGQSLHGQYVFASFANASLDQLRHSCPVLEELGPCRRVQCPGDLPLTGDVGSIEVTVDDRVLLSASPMISFPGYYAEYQGDETGDTPFLPTEDPFVVVRGTGGVDVPTFAQSIGVPRPFTIEAPESLARGEDLRVTWATSGADEMGITIVASGRSDLPAISCIVPAAAGALTIPSSLFADLLETSSIDIDAVALVTEVVTAGDYTIAVTGHYYSTTGSLAR